jgi:oligopeptidase B
MKYFGKTDQLRFLVLMAAGFLAGMNADSSAQEIPRAARREHFHREHGVERFDPYYWMNNRDDPELLDYLKRENQYLEGVMEGTKPLQATLVQEFRQRIPQADKTVPQPQGDWLYFVETFADRDYPAMLRMPAGSTDPAQGAVILDVNQLAEGKSYCSVGQTSVNDAGKIMGYSVDSVGRRIYNIFFRDLESGQEIGQPIENVTGQFVWAADNQTIFYTRQHPETLRSYQVFRHVLGSDPADDSLVYQEDDEEFNLQLERSRSKKYLMIVSSQTVSTEVRYLPSDEPLGPWQVFQPRQRELEYSVDHIGDYFYVLTNHQATNFRLMRCGGEDTRLANWQEVIPHREDVLLESFDLFDNRLVLTETGEALTRLRVTGLDGAEGHQIEFDEPVYVVASSPIESTATPWLRLTYESPTTPTRTLEYHLENREFRLLKQQEIKGGFDRDNYRCLRLWATARDGVRVPITLVHHKDVIADGNAPLYVYGYGSYGYSMTPNFNPFAISLLDRGFVMATAHIRGGQEMGRKWYEEGKLLNKMNTFTDFIDVTEYLLSENWGSRNRVYAQGGSAGGLLMGAVINLRPDLYHGVVADVPFVDVVTTMLDDSIPLTTFEYDEWGNPNDKVFFDYMLSYSPYDQVSQKEYPNLLVTSGLHDSQVQYWEPTKWVAKLRTVQSPGQLILLKTNLEAGHGGASARNKRYQERAETYAFLLKLAAGQR